MTTVQMAKAIARLTGYPERMVRHILDVQTAIIKNRLLHETEIVFSGLFRITPKERTINVKGFKEAAREKIQRLTLSIKPLRGFRKELNQWTSSQ